MNALISGLSLEAKDILESGLSKAFGEVVIDIVELNKDNLRQRVRLSRNNVNDILVILDKVSSDLCRDIEDGLYSSDKFHTYEDENSLVSFLNEKYGLSLEYKGIDESISARDDIDSELVETLNARLSDKERFIKDLQGRISELENIIAESGCNEEKGIEPIVDTAQVDELSSQILALKEQILNMESENNISVSNLLKEKDSLKILLEESENKRNLLSANFTSVSDELADYRTKYSEQSGVIRSKDLEIKRLEEKLSESSSLRDMYSASQLEKSKLEEELKTIRLESSNLKVDYNSKCEEVVRLTGELANAGVESEKQEALNRELLQVTTERDDLQKKVNSADSKYNTVYENYINLQNEVSSKDTKIEELTRKVESNDKDLITLNTEKLELQNRVSILEKSTSRDTEYESVMNELVELRQKYDSMSSNVFSRISSLALPKGSTNVQLIRGIPTYENIRFVFSGSTESRKGTYKCLLDEFKSLPSSEQVVIVDVVSETSIDYVFEIKQVRSAINWFAGGGGIQSYLTPTCLSNVHVLSAGLGYVNDTYFLTVDWEARLNELNKSGYKVVLYCGDISNIVGRVMHESFARLGMSLVYVHGNAIGSRAVVSNLKGLTNSSESIVCYFDFNKKMQRFCDLVRQTNECRVLSYS